MLLKKGWIFVIVAVIICVVGFIFGRSQAPQDPIKIYKAVPPPQEPPQRVVAVQPTQLETDSQAQDIATDIGRQVPQTPPPRGSVQSEAQGYVLPPPGGGIVTDTSIDPASEMTAPASEMTAPASEMTESVVDRSYEDKAPSLSAEELRRQELLRERAHLHEQLKTLSPGGTVHSADDPQNVHQALTLIKELTLIEQELNGQDNTDILRYIQRGINTTQSLTPDGKMPIPAAAKLADAWEEDGNFEGARIMRLAIQNARKNRDEFLKEEHIEESQ